MKMLKVFSAVFLLGLSALFLPQLGCEEYYSVSVTELNFLQETIAEQTQALQDWQQKSRSWEQDVMTLSDMVKKRDASLTKLNSEIKKEKEKRAQLYKCTVISIIINVGLGLVIMFNLR